MMDVSTGLSKGPFVDRVTVVIEETAEVLHWVDRMLQELNDHPEMVRRLSEDYAPLLWVIDHIAEARFAMKDRS